LISSALLACTASSAPRTAQPGAVEPPVAARRPERHTLHGETRVDDYGWLRKKDAPEVLAYLRAENAYSERLLQPTVALRDAIYAETIGRIVQTDQSAPIRRGQFLYYSRTREGLQYPIECRAPLAEPAKEEVLLDANELAKSAPFVDIGVMEVSDDGTRLAYSVDTTGFREYTLHVLELGSRALGPERIAKVSSAAWAADGRTLFYTVEDGAKRPYRLYRHTTGGSAPDALVYEETDARFVLHVWRSRSKAFVLAGSFSHTASEIRFVSATVPDGQLSLIAPRRADHEYDVDHRGDRFYIRSNDRGRNFRIVTAPVGTPGEAHWQELVPHSDAVMVENLDVFDRFMVLHERENGVPQVRVSDPEGGSAHRVALPEPVYEVHAEDNPEPDADRYRFSYESLTTPERHYDYAIADRSLAVVKQKQVLGGYDPARYRSERITARAADGTLIPISLVRRADAPAGPRPLLLTGYGAYGYPLPASFSYSRVSVLDRGVTFAIAHVRGGGELGKRWHDAGRMQHKANSFSDFIAAAEHLIGSGYTSPDRLAIEGGSAGGLLIGAVINQRPELFRAALLDVPFVDVLNTMSDPSLPLTVGEFEEWGNPALLDQYRNIAAYSPYDNLRAQAYPAMLVETSYNDSQVMYWEPAKYVAKLRTLKTDDRPLLLWVNMAGGHGGSSGRYDQWRERAFDLAFLLWQLGVRR
jgi:oligopeptidase B